MAKREINKLTALAVTNKKAAGYYPDGNGLFLRILPTGGKSWMLIFSLDKRRREMALGAYPEISLQKARDKAAETLILKRKGIDPIEQRKAERDALRVENAKRVIFRDAANDYIRLNGSSWKNAKHAAQWTKTLETYAYPLIGDLPCEAINTDLVKRVLTPIWIDKAETASRVRGRIQSVLSAWAASNEIPNYANPAAWTGHLEKVMPKREAVQKVKHHAALPLDEMGQFMQELRQQKGEAARALELTILCATRTSETIGMTWGEVDLKESAWTIPAERMKAKKEHRIPLSSRASEILAIQYKTRQEDDVFVFRSNSSERPLSNMAMLVLLKRMGRENLTVHGFRSTFRDWAGEKTNFAREVIEHALAHQLKDKAEASYARGTLFDKRRKLMQAWASYVESVWLKSDEVLLLFRGRKLA